MKTVALLLSALNIKTFLCQYLDCEYFKNETSNLVMCSCQVKNSDLDQNNTTTGNVSDVIIMNEEITGNSTIVEIRNCIETEFLNMITFPTYFDLADNQTFQILVQNTTNEKRYEESTVTESVENQLTTTNISTNITSDIGLSKYSSSEDTRKTDIIFYYLTIGLGGLSGILLVALIILGVLFRVKTKNQEGTNKQVSRAESWRYESSIYIKPPNNQAKIAAQKQIIHPHLQSNPRSTAPSSLTNSPLMRPRHNNSAVFRGADIVRSTMTNGQGQIDEKYQRSRTETYHGPLTDISDTDYAMSVSSDSENEDDQLFNSQQCNASTIPFR